MTHYLLIAQLFSLINLSFHLPIVYFVSRRNELRMADINMNPNLKPSEIFHVARSLNPLSDIS